MEEIVYRVNFDYEYKLFHDGQSPPWKDQVNRNLEFLALLWGGIPQLNAVREYSDEYLRRIAALGIDLPKLTNEKATENFWGEEKDLDLERILNSKKTSFLFSQKQNWSLPGERLIEKGERITIPKGCVLRPIDSVSGRGFIFDSTEKELDVEAILCPWVDRIIDVSFVWDGDQENYLLNINDSRGCFKGAVVADQIEKIIEKKTGHSFEEVAETTQKIMAYYKSLGAKYLQIDSFFYQKNGCVHYYPLCEVNYRRTLGGLALRLKKGLLPHAKIMSLSFGGQQAAMEKRLRLSPDDNLWPLDIVETSEKF